MMQNYPFILCLVPYISYWNEYMSFGESPGSHVETHLWLAVFTA